MKKAREEMYSTQHTELYDVANIHVLPEELLHEIIRVLPSPSTIATVSLLSKHFYQLAQNPTTWRQLVQNLWSIKEFGKVARNFNWKTYTREKYEINRPLKWQPIDVEPHPPPRQSHGAVHVGNKMIVLGGHQLVEENFQRQDDIWEFDTLTNQFERIVPKGAVVPAISRHRVVNIGNQVYIFGGILQNKQKLNSIFTLDVDNMIWQELTVSGNPPDPRCDPVVVVHGSTIIVFGGSVQDLVFPSDIHVFDTLTNTWREQSTTGPIPPPRIGCTGAVVGDTLYIYGGGDYDKQEKKYVTLFTEIWTLDLIKFEWSQVRTIGERPKVSDFLNAFVIGNHIVIEGGWYEEPYAFDTVARAWVQLKNEDNLKVNNNDSSATLIGNAVYYFGGYDTTYRHHLYKLDLSHLDFLNPRIVY
jgi:N-acetylneuraminic acid mutarotase